jgi:hypothetical protein
VGDQAVKAALLCPGPSLVQTFDDDFAGWRVGVNRAALAFKCDWWAALDHGPIEREKIGGIPLITTLAAKQHLTAFLPERLKDFPRVVTCEDLYDFLPLHVNWPTFSRDRRACALCVAGSDGRQRVRRRLDRGGRLGRRRPRRQQPQAGAMDGRGGDLESNGSGAGGEGCDCRTDQTMSWQNLLRMDAAGIFASCAAMPNAESVTLKWTDGNVETITAPVFRAMDSLVEGTQQAAPSLKVFVPRTCDRESLDPDALTIVVADRVGEEATDHPVIAVEKSQPGGWLLRLR